jgi:CheY-like chemotaxis protein
MKLEIDYTPAELNINRHSIRETDWEEMLNAGIDCAKTGRRAEAKHWLARAAEANPDSESAWLWLASISEYPEELLVFLNNVLRINPENQRALDWVKATKPLLADTFVNRGADAARENKKEYAAQCFTQALLHDSQNESAWLWLASIAESSEEKAAHLQKVLEINPENETALASLHTIKHQLSQQLLQKANFAAISGDRDRARSLLAEAMLDAPDLEDAWILKAYLADDSQEKIDCYEKVLSLNPENETAQAGLASLQAIIQKNTAQKSNAEMLRDVFESSGAEVLYAAASPDFTPAMSVATEQIPENADEASARLFENYESEAPAQFISEIGAVGDFPAESFDENPTDELNANFVEEIKAQGGFAEETLDVIPAEAIFSEPDDSASAEEINEDSNFIAFDQNEEIQIVEDSEADEVLQFVKEAEARLFQNEETKPLYFENTESEQEEDSFAYQLPEVENIENFETPAELEFDDALPPVEEPQQFEDHSYSNEPLAAEQNFFEQTNFENDNLDLSANVQAAEKMQEVSPEQNIAPEEIETEFSAKDEAEENPSEQILHKSLSPNEPLPCSFCFVMNEPHSIVCCSCRAMFSLSDMEMLLAYAEADHKTLEMAVEDLENEKISRPLSAPELTNLGIAYLNLKNLRKALECLQEASQLSPNDVVLASKANFLAIRLSEIEAQESKMDGVVVKNLTVMVIDDSPTVRKLISGKLEKCGHTVVTAADGAEALDKIREVVPDLILLDIMMPQMDGYQVCKLIRSNEPTRDVPVVMISGKDGFFDKVRGRMAGTSGYITKPFGPETLMRAIETYVS